MRFYEDLTKIIFQLSLNTHLISSSDCENPFEASRQGASKKYPQLVYRWRNKQNSIFHEIIIITSLLL